MKTNFLLYRHPDAVWIALQGGFFTLIAIIVSGVSIKFETAVISFAWVPLAAIFLWPRWSHSFLTPILIAVLGLITDLLLGQLLGLSSLVYLIFFWLVKPTEREVHLKLWRAWLEFALISTLILYASIFIVGRVVDIAVGWRSLMQQTIAMVSFFPVIFLLRAIIRRWLIDPNDVNYQ